MKNIIIILILIVFPQTVLHSQNAIGRTAIEICSILDNADANFYGYMGFRKSNLIYENEIPKILEFLNDSKNSIKSKTKILNRWYKSQSIFAKGLEYKYGNQVNSAMNDLTTREYLLSLGIKYIQNLDDGPEREQPFVASSDLFIKYSVPLNDSVFTSFLKIIKQKTGWPYSVQIIMDCESFLKKYPSSYYSKEVYNIFTNYATTFLSNNSLFEFDPGGTPHCEKIQWLIDDNKKYLDKFPTGRISQLVSYNINRLIKIKPKFCQTEDKYKRIVIIRNP